jgi:hypothetical protein
MEDAIKIVEALYDFQNEHPDKVVDLTTVLDYLGNYEGEANVDYDELMLEIKKDYGCE